MIKAPDERYPRYSRKPFPAYRFIPGQNPHPSEDPKGHSYGRKEDKPGILTADNWHENETYLFGVDLYNYAYWWESHEAWEGLWRLAPPSSPNSHFLQGLIKISATFLKWHAKNQRGLETLYTGGMEHLQEALDHSSVLMGLNLMEHIAKLSQHFREVVAQPGQWPNPLKDYPFIVLEKK